MDLAILDSTDSPFLRLPLEVRLQIYGFLIPDIPVLNYNFIDGPTRKASTKFRHDAQVLSPQLLQVNKQIHAEATPAFYGNALFQISTKNVGRQNYMLLGRRASWSPPPFVMRYIRKLQLTIHINGFRHVNLSDSPGDQTNKLAGLIHDTLRHPQSCLEDIQLHIGFDADFWYRQVESTIAQGREEEHIRALLDPLRLVNGLKKVEVTKYQRSAQSRRHQGEEVTQLQAILDREVEEVKDAMMAPLIEGAFCQFCKVYRGT